MNNSTRFFFVITVLSLICLISLSVGADTAGEKPHTAVAQAEKVYKPNSNVKELVRIANLETAKNEQMTEELLMESKSERDGLQETLEHSKREIDNINEALRVLTEISKPLNTHEDTTNGNSTNTNADK